MKKTVIILIILFILGFSATKVYEYILSRDGTRQVPEQNWAIATLDKIETKVSAPGVVEPKKRDILKAGKGDTINQVLVKVNTEVKKGTNLVTFTSKSKTLQAPYDGIVSKIIIETGDVVSAGMPLLEIFDNKNLLTKIMVDEWDLPSIKKGQQVDILVNAYPNKVYTGEVTDISQEGKTTGGISSFPVTIAFFERENVKVGMTTEVTIVTDFKEEVLVVPIEAVSITDGSKSVLVLNQDGTAESRIVETGLYSNTLVEIISGLEEGEKVRLPQASNDLFQLIPKSFPVHGKKQETDSVEESAPTFEN